MKLASGQYAITRDRHNPLAPVAARLCASYGHPRHRHNACLPCWGEAIRRDERIRVEENLPTEHGDDASLVDEVAVERFCAGEAGAPRFRELNWAERVEAATRLIRAGWSTNQVQKSLKISGFAWQRVTAATSDGTPARA